MRPAGQVTFQVQFGEYGGSYVNHCHNTVHEDFAMLMRIQLQSGDKSDVRSGITSTPNPTQDGVFFTIPEVLPEADPANKQFFGTGTAQPAATTTPATTAPTSGGTGGGKV